jgi:hypothetical protein
MKPKKIELIAFIILVAAFLLRLRDFLWVEPILYLDFLILIGVWIYGFAKKKGLEGNGYKIGEFLERLFLIVLITGIIMTICDIPMSNMILSFGLLLAAIYQFFKGIFKLIKVEIFTGPESIIICVILIGYLFRVMYWPFSGPITVVACSLLAQVYFGYGIFFNIKLSKSKNSTLGILGMFIYWILGLYLIAVLFDTMFWPGSTPMLALATVIGAILITIFVINYYKLDQLESQITDLIHDLFKRFVIIVSIGVFLLVATQQHFLKFIFGNRPQIIEAYTNCRLKKLENTHEQESNCHEYKSLFEFMKTGYYKEGISNEDLKRVREWHEDSNKH